MILGTIHFEHSNTPLRRPHVPPPPPTPDHQHQRRGMYRLENNQFISHDKPSNNNGKAKRIHIPTVPPIDLSTDPPPILEQPLPSQPTPCPPSHVPSNSPALVSMSNARLLRSIGFLSSPKIHKALTTASLPTIRIEHVDRNPTLDPGEIASLRAADRTTEPSPLPSKAGDLYQCDIGFGPTRSIGGAFYTLLLVDKRTRYAFIYPLKNLKENLLLQFKVVQSAFLPYVQFLLLFYSQEKSIFRKNLKCSKVHVVRNSYRFCR